MCSALENTSVHGYHCPWRGAHALGAGSAPAGCSWRAQHSCSACLPTLQPQTQPRDKKPLHSWEAAQGTEGRQGIHFLPRHVGQLTVKASAAKLMIFLLTSTRQFLSSSACRLPLWLPADTLISYAMLVLLLQQ